MDGLTKQISKASSLVGAAKPPYTVPTEVEHTVTPESEEQETELETGSQSVERTAQESMYLCRC